MQINIYVRYKFSPQKAKCSFNFLVFKNFKSIYVSTTSKVMFLILSKKNFLSQMPQKNTLKPFFAAGYFLLFSSISLYPLFQ